MHGVDATVARDALDVRALREDFPILRRVVDGKPLIYLDNAATSQKPRAVIDALVRYYEEYNANIHRGVHTLGQQATDAYEQVREKVARFIHAPDPAGVVFTRNTTEAINIVASAWGRRYIREGDEILVSEMEHHSNLVPWQLLARDVGARIRAIPVTAEGTLDLSSVETLLSPRTRLVAVVHVSNVLGTINPVRRLADLAHRQGALILVDGAQSVPHLPVDVQEVGCDFIAFSSHKMLGPTGVGVLYASPSLLEQMDVYQGGGSMIRQVTLDHSTWAPVPTRFEAGTPSIADAIALGAAIDYLGGLGMANVRAHEIDLTRYALGALGSIPEVRLYGPADPLARGGVISFNFADVHPHDVGTVLDSEGIAIRAGHHCCQPLMRRLGAAATVRASFYVYNTHKEVDALVRALARVKELFGVGVRCALP
ncbi:MAG: cysteine desulfurase [Chloroflexi bacterium]|nr:cysteine desulfurase [Chloroflexota bacterium]